jgi:glycerophosphoryl diester phosphodiesterase
MKRRSTQLVALTLALIATLIGAVAAGAVSTGKADDQGNRRDKSLPIVIGHRGASGYRPEHTIASYQLAIDLGADYIEPDLVSTKDHKLVARHENDITGTTDVADHPEFASRKTTKVVDGVSITGWFTEDFTLAELKTLRAVERLPATLRPGNHAFDKQFEIPTFQEVIDLAKRNHVGIYPETKHPSYFDSIGLSLEEPLVAALKANGLDRKDAPVFVQSFEVSNLKQLNQMTKAPLVQLLNGTGKPFDFVLANDPRTYADLATPAGLHEISKYADGIGPDSRLIVPIDLANHVLAPTSLIQDAQKAGLLVHPFTFRRENTFLPEEYRRGDKASPFYLMATGDIAGWMRLFYKLGVDGFFTDNSDVGVAVRHTVFDQ